MTPWLQDADVTLYHGDVLAVLRELPAESVDCCVTSPPYWGLRDYGTGAWDGGEEGCDHTPPKQKERTFKSGAGVDGRNCLTWTERDGTTYGQTCGKCGATRIDQQLGLEPTPEEYVTRMVEVFREVRRVLAAHGTVWLNLGDSYVSTPNGNKPGDFSTSSLTNPQRQERVRAAQVKDGKAVHGDVLRPHSVDGLAPKNLVGIPWRVAFALQADGWYLRSDIIWAKPNPMPESVTDRPTKAHEYVFLLSKQPRYFFDQEAVRERYEGGSMRNGFRGEYDGPSAYIAQQGPQNNSAKGPDGRAKTTVQGADGSIQHRDGERWPNGGRNIRSVWEIATQPYPEAHFATFPEELARRCIAAGCPESVCRVCGKARERIISTTYDNEGRTSMEGFTDCGCLDPCPTHDFAGGFCMPPCPDRVLGGRYRPGVTLDPFIGSGTVAHVARKLGRHAVGIDLSEEYLKLAARRLQQQSLFASEVASGL